MRRMRRGLCGVLCLVLLLGLLPAAALAEETGGQGTHWAQSAVEQLNKIYGSNLFSTSDDDMTVSGVQSLLTTMGCSTDKLKDASGNLTRGQACEVLADVFSLPVAENQPAIQYLYQQNIISGTSEYNLDETGFVSQAEFAVLTYRVLNAVGGGLGSSNKALKPGTDEYFAWMYLAARDCVSFSTEGSTGTIDADTWQQWIDALTGENIPDDAKPKPSGAFDPDMPDPSTTKLSAAVQIVKEYIKAGGSPTIFSDVPADNGFYDGVMYLFDQGLISGSGDGTFDPNGALPRYQLAVLLARIGDDYPLPTDTDPDDPFAAYKQYAVEEGYMDPPGRRR